MKKIKEGLLLLVLINSIGNATTNNDAVFVDRMLISNSANGFLLSSVLLGDSVEWITSKDKIMLYYAHIGVVNPTKKKYNVETMCVDAKGNIIIKGAIKRTVIAETEGHIGKDVVKNLIQTIGLDPKIGAMVKGQLIPLKNGNDYFIKLFVENKLIGITKFHYAIED